MKFLIISFFVVLATNSPAQPYIDLVNIRYLKSPDAGAFRRDFQQNHFDYFNLSFNLPVIFKKDSSAIIFSPFAERWNIELNKAPYLPDHFQSLALPVTYLKPLTKKWTVAFTIIPRWNGYNYNWFSNNFQAGGAFVATYKKHHTLKYKFGIYYNNEFSATFIMPLLGIEWKINPKNLVFGTLPGNLTWEHKSGNRFYYGAVFRAITNTYQSGEINGNPYFMRMDDNQLSIYSDIYFAKKIALTIEAGHSVLRRIRLGIKDGQEKYFYTTKTNDNWIFKAGLAYRLRF